MKAKYGFGFGAALFIAAFLALACRYVRSARQARVELADLAEKRSMTEAAIHRARSQISAKPRKNIGPKAGRKGTSPRTAAVSAAAIRLARQLETDRDDPKMSANMLALSRAEHAVSYAQFYRMLGLTPTQIEMFEANLAKRQETQFDLDNVVQAEAAANNGAVSPETAAAVKTFRSQAADNYQADQKSLLGSTGWQRLVDYTRAMPAQGYVSSLAGAAVVAGIPLTTAQSYQLAQAMTQASTSYQSGKPVSMQDIDWSAVDTHAKSFLSDTQLNLVQTVEPTHGLGRFSAQFMTGLQKALAAEKPK